MWEIRPFIGTRSDDLRYFRLHGKQCAEQFSNYIRTTLRKKSSATGTNFKNQFCLSEKLDKFMKDGVTGQNKTKKVDQDTCLKDYRDV